MMTSRTRGILIDITELKRAETALAGSEEKYRRLIENSHDIVYTISSDGIMTFVSPSWTDLLGHPVDQVIGKHFRCFVHPDDVEKCNEFLQLVLETGARQSGVEYRVRHADGSWLWHETKAVPLEDEAGKVIGFEGNAADITKRKAAEEALREAEERLDLSVRGTGTGLWDWMVQTGEVVFSEKWAEIVGCTLEELAPVSIDTWRRLCHPDGLRLAEELLEKHFAGETEGYECETRLKHKNGEWIWVLDRGKVFEWTDDRKPVRMVGTHMDITRRKVAEEALLRANEELKGYAHTVSHDLKAPLTAADLAAELLSIVLEGERSEGLAGNVGDAMRVIKKGIRRSLELIIDLLALAEAERAPEMDDRVDVSGVVRSILREKEVLLDDHGVRVSVDDDLGFAGMDQTHAYQLFENLIGNSIKYNDSENPEIRISSPGEAGPGTLHYLVSDNGSGIPESLLDTLFTPFVKGEQGGTGIGLSIVDKVVRLYGGEVRAYNDGGACFEFTLPTYSS